eukprot:TRINITY_DN10507_c0_g1_i6.p1 TRINITY_DN10507_c0_g1~~TRINITY_DN10507_c0_g1_i6.p1  ORF type:complete len:254 (-),score=69.00 TRINITY_DN10507_c0_g1_i6:56-817(-)
MQSQEIHTTPDQNCLLSSQQLCEWRTYSSGKGCSRERSRQSLAYIGSKDPWTELEEFKMIVAHRKYKNRWSDMTDLLKGRSNNTIKNKFYSVFRKVKSKIQKADYSYDSKLELLEIHYIISLIEYHLEHPTPFPKAKGKRGKDFIYSLIHNLTQEAVADYKEKVQRLAKDEGSIEELINELTESFKEVDGVRTQYQTPALNPPFSEEKLKSACIENQGISELGLYNIDFDELLSTPFRLPNPCLLYTSDAADE